ncbi:unknown [Clostridium sp. CAG:609]|nr:unknown [Clostridium sp. CAG:609]
MNDLKKYSSDEVIKLIKKTVRNYSFNDSFQLIIY